MKYLFNESSLTALYFLNLYFKVDQLDLHAKAKNEV